MTTLANIGIAQFTMSSSQGASPGKYGVVRADHPAQRIIRPEKNIRRHEMTYLDNRVLDVLKFYDSPEGWEFWKRNKAEQGMDWEDNVINLCIKVGCTPDLEEFESVFLRIKDILIARGIMRIPA
jgi:squalene cyclase